jgi:hypothetical protein
LAGTANQVGADEAAKEHHLAHHEKEHSEDGAWDGKASSSRGLAGLDESGGQITHGNGARSFAQ